MLDVNDSLWIFVVGTALLLLPDCFGSVFDLLLMLADEIEVSVVIAPIFFSLVVLWKENVSLSM